MNNLDTFEQISFRLFRLEKRAVQFKVDLFYIMLEGKT